MKENPDISFNHLCENLGNAYVHFLIALNDMKKQNNDYLTGGINHTDCKNHFLSNAYLSKFDKFALDKEWIYHSKAAKKRIDEAKNKRLCGLCFEHIVPKQEYLQDKCEKLVKEKKEAAIQEVIELIKKYWKIAVVTSEENKRLLVRTMPKGWNEGDDLFERYNKPKDNGEKILLYNYRDEPIN